MDYKFTYNTDIYFAVKDPNYEEEVMLGDVYLRDGLRHLLENNLDEINKTLSNYGIKLAADDNSLSNDSSRRLIVKSNTEVDVSNGLNALAISYKNSNELFLLTFEPMKLIYNSYLPEVNQRLIKAIKGKYSYFYIVMLNKLQSIDNYDLLDDISTASDLREYVDKYKDTKDALMTLIKLIKLDKNIKNKNLIMTGVEKALTIYNKMIKDYKELDKLRFEIDIHTGNWKYLVTKKGKIIVPIDPFVIFYGNIKQEISLFNKLGKDFIKNNKN